MSNNTKRFLANKGLDNNGNTIVNTADPVNAQDVATKNFASNASNLSSGSIASAILGNSTVYIGTTAIALNRAYGVMALTGITSIDGNAATATKLATSRTISVTGDATLSVGFDGSANVSGILALATTGVAAGTYNNITVDAKGRVTSGSNVVYLTANQTITLSGDVTGSGGTAIAASLATVNSSPVTNSFQKVTVNGKGLVTATTNVLTADITSALGYTPVNKAGDTMTGGLTATSFTGSGAGLTNIPNAALSNPGLTFGSTFAALGSAVTTLSGFTSIAASSFTGSLTGNASTATSAARLTTAQLIQATGDASWGVNFDGSATASGSLTLAASGVSAGTYGTASGSIPVIAIDSKGRVTSATNTPISSLPSGVTAPAMLGSSASSFSAAGSSQATAAGIVSDITYVTSATAGTAYCVSLPSVAAGRKIMVINGSGTAILVYPASGQYIDSLAVNAAILLPVQSRSYFVGTVGATRWASSLLDVTSGANLVSGSVPISALVSGTVTIGSTPVTLGTSTSTLSGLSAVTATNFNGNLSGNASTATNATNATTASQLSAVTDVGNNGLYGVPLFTGTGTGNYGGRLRAGLTYDTTNNALNIPGYLNTTNGIFNSAASNNQLIQCATNSLASGLGLWAGGTSAIYSTGGLTIRTGATLTANGIPVGSVAGLYQSSTGTVGIGTTTPSSALQVIGTVTATTFSGPLSGNATTSTGVQAVDSRSTNGVPGVTGTGVFFDLKLNSTDGLADEPNAPGNVGYHSVMTVQQYQDPSGGSINQFGFSGAGNLWVRTATPATGASNGGWTSYGSWYKFAKLNVDRTLSINSSNGNGVSTQMASFVSSGNSSSLNIGSAGGAGAFLSGTVLGDSTIRADSGNLAIGPYANGNACYISSATAVWAKINANGISTGAVTASGSMVTANRVVASSGGGDPGWGRAGDIISNRGDGTGVIYLGASGQYLWFDGANYNMPNGQLKLNGQITLNAGNYNNYTPTLTGTGASGTWPIAISGNAATSSVAATLGSNGNTSSLMTFSWAGQSGQPTWVWGGNSIDTQVVWNPANFNVATAVSSTNTSWLTYRGHVTADTSTNFGATGAKLEGVYNNGYPITYGNVLSLAGDGYGQLLIGWAGSTGAVADNYIRSLRDSAVGTGSGWSAWAKIITDQNYTSYALPITGGTLTGGLTVNPGSANSYNEGIRVMAASDGYSVLALGANSSGSGTTTNQVSLIRSPDGALNVVNGSGTYATSIDQSGNFSTSGYANANRFVSGYDSGVAGSINCNQWFRASGATGLYLSTYSSGIYFAATGSNGTNSFTHGSIASYNSANSNGWSGYSIAGTIVFMANIGSANTGTWGIYNDLTSQWLVQGDPSGNVTFLGSVTADGNVTAYSDARIKTNITPVSNARRRLLDTVTGVSFTRTDSGQESMGVIAQAVEKEFPTLVQEVDPTKSVDGEKQAPIKSVNYNGLIAPIIETLRELDEENQQLKTQLKQEQMAREALETRLARLESLLFN